MRGRRRLDYMALYPPCPVTGISGSCRSRPDETGGVPACRPLAGCWAPLHFQASSENRGGDGVPRWRNGAILSSQPDRSAAGRSESATIASRSRVGRLTNRLREARTRLPVGWTTDSFSELAGGRGAWCQRAERQRRAGARAPRRARAPRARRSHCFCRAATPRCAESAASAAHRSRASRKKKAATAPGRELIGAAISVHWEAEKCVRSPPTALTALELTPWLLFCDCCSLSQRGAQEMVHWNRV